ncbi:MAG: hypothetical protein A2Y62_02010 [Candidatus Fischerbacteria bacterium RBG_13_37_8]|uniref:Uncharacterized protein n=1 Tax=Candidatus Fischerbacteria bacterium RBG_13_37_8 TaxID=1817863 RepID=A0A1F5VJK4_9BACT|nr:MAG: hypothetical protein A2Y62_02010 [Candidatus Fischerbacteria bacterium RBG_13_37_8]
MQTAFEQVNQGKNLKVDMGFRTCHNEASLLKLIENTIPDLKTAAEKQLLSDMLDYLIDVDYEKAISFKNLLTPEKEQHP